MVIIYLGVQPSVAESGFVGQPTSQNNVCPQGCVEKNSEARRTTPLHWEASSAHGKGSARPVQGRRANQTFCEIRREWPRVHAQNMQVLRWGFQIIYLF